MSASILVVEDDTDMREILSELLTAEGYRVFSASNGREGLDQLRAGLRPSVVLLDLTMPVMDGWEFRARQTEDPALRSIPIIVTTAMPPSRVGPMPGVSVLRKPLDLDSLISLIRSHIDES
jgi:CheY-like chemotaxis protein